MDTMWVLVGLPCFQAFCRFKVFIQPGAYKYLEWCASESALVILFEFHSEMAEAAAGPLAIAGAQGSWFVVQKLRRSRPKCRLGGLGQGRQSTGGSSEATLDDQAKRYEGANANT
jgi:hypothetical protein